MKVISAIPVLPVINMDEGVQFYTQVLGLKLIHQQDGYAVLQADSVQIHLWLANDESWRDRNDEPPVVSGAESFIAGTHSCRIEVTDARLFYQKLKVKNSLHPNALLSEKEWGSREFGVSDPYGNLITFFEWI